LEGNEEAGVVACRRAVRGGRGRECGERKAVARFANSSTLSTGSQPLHRGIERLLLLPLLLVVVVVIVVSFVGGAAAGAGAWTEEGRERRRPVVLKSPVLLGKGEGREANELRLQ